MLDEILVHISTPATRQNDDLFRSLADAYLDFEPHRRFGDELCRENDEQDLLLPAQSGTSAIVPQDRVDVETSILTTSKESYGSFPSYISSGGQTDIGVASIDDGSIPTSSRLARLDYIHARWKEQTTPKSSFANEQRQSRPTSRTSKEYDHAFIENTQLGARALQSQLPDSYSSTDEDTSEGEPEADVSLPRVSSIPINQRSTRSTRLEIVCPAKPAPVVSRREPRSSHAVQRSGAKVEEAQKPILITSNPAVAKVSADQQGVPQPESILGSSRSATQASGKKRRALDETSSSADIQDFSMLSFDAFPPAPKVSIERPSRLPSQITKYLAAIKAQNPKRFRHSKKHRTPKADERGCWSVSCSSWPVRIQHEFWNALCEHVASGRLGWGITLHREASSAHVLGKVRLYCWAELAEHTWLIIWLCSKGLIAGSASKWVDADGAAVFEVI